MTTNLLTLLILLNTIHWVFDFWYQTDQMAINKSKSFKWLGIHSLVYSIAFWFIDWRFGLVALVSHFIIDGITSRSTSYFWQKEDRHNFFATIGFDQLLHSTVILLFVYFAPIITK